MHRGERYGNNNNNDSHNNYRHSRGHSHSRFSDSPVSNYDSRRSPGSFRSGGAPHHRAFDSPPRWSPGRVGGFRSIGGGDGFRPMGGEGPGEFGFNSHQAPPLSGQKRGFPFPGRGGSPDHFDGGNFAKLFVGSVPRTATEEDIRPLFEEHGNVIEVALIKDRKTGQHQGCCFIKYATSGEADQAIRALHNQHTLPGGVGPIQVRYADGERERLGAVEYKLFVGSLNKQATVKEVEEIFSEYGRVEDVYLMRDEKKQSRGCGFVKYSHRDMALAAINALNGIYTMRGCEQPLIVRFADPKRPRQGESRGPAFGGPGFGPRFDAPGTKLPSHFSDPMGDRMLPPNAWRPMHPPNMGPSSNAGLHGMGPPLLPRSGDMALSINAGGPMSGMGGPIDGRYQVQSLSSMSQQISPSQKPIQSSQELPTTHRLYPQAPMPYPQMSTLSSLRQHGQPQLSLSAGPLPSQQVHGVSGQYSTSQPQTQQSAFSAAIPQNRLDTSMQSNTALATPNQQQVPPSVQQQPLQPLQQSPSQLAQMLSQQTQTLQASFNSSQQAFSQLQQQLQMMQPSSQALTLQQNAEATKKQSQWAGTVAQAVASTHVAAPAAVVPSSTSVTSALTAISQNVAVAKCNWTEHISPEGFKYYYNSVTGESRWEKPEELTSSEQQRPSVQQSQTQSQPSTLSTQQVPQFQQVQPQSHLQGQVLHQQQIHQPSLSSSFQAYGITGHQNVQEVGYKQLQASVFSAGDPGRYSQGIHTTHEMMWKNKPAGV
ncbi:flowering time control protein FCA isoform X2 [Gastrolobium bilobum]|uniref:flowering time control protein FCA isoform X2 n=1 Tax=Gastrolobium bilobum TaxID=150636 RepID=UPI002AAFC87A|nr:flowering time control protein FCA isoform X2 [Gastrolobium bilobum]